jgi:hypothetical protein
LSDWAIGNWAIEFADWAIADCDLAIWRFGDLAIWRLRLRLNQQSANHKMQSPGHQ